MDNYGKCYVFDRLEKENRNIIADDVKKKQHRIINETVFICFFNRSLKYIFLKIPMLT